MNTANQFWSYCLTISCSNLPINRLSFVGSYGPNRFVGHVVKIAGWIRPFCAERPKPTLYINRPLVETPISEMAGTSTPSSAEFDSVLAKFWGDWSRVKRSKIQPRVVHAASNTRAMWPNTTTKRPSEPIRGLWINEKPAVPLQPESFKSTHLEQPWEHPGMYKELCFRRSLGVLSWHFDRWLHP